MMNSDINITSVGVVDRKFFSTFVFLFSLGLGAPLASFGPTLRSLELPLGAGFPLAVLWGPFRRPGAYAASSQLCMIIDERG